MKTITLMSTTAAAISLAFFALVPQAPIRHKFQSRSQVNIPKKVKMNMITLRIH